MIRIHFTPEDFARVRLAPRPAPLQEVHAALATMSLPDGSLLRAPWRRRALRALPGAARPLADLVPAGLAPGFLDTTADTLPDALDQVAAWPVELVSAELERVHASVRAPAPAWVHGLYRGEPEAWRLVRQAQQAAFGALLGPVWAQVQDLHHAEFVRRAVQLAEGGAALLLPAVLPGSRLRDGVWELPGPAREIRIGGRGLLLLPSFHWFGEPLLSDLRGRPVTVTYPAGSGFPPLPDGTAGAASPEALARVIGGTRTELLHLLAEEHTTTELARRLRISAATVSAHTAALRGAGLISTSRAGKAVLHRRTALGSLLLGAGSI
ncbi:ArsR/SmtB family transcription factor [Kitasatospora sp. NPDC001159]